MICFKKAGITLLLLILLLLLLLVLVFKEASLFRVSSNVFDLVIEFGGMSLFVIEFSLVVPSREARVFFNGYTPPLFI